MPAIPLATLIPMIVEAIQKLAPIIQQWLSSSSGQAALTSYENSNKDSTARQALLDGFNSSLSVLDSPITGASFTANASNLSVTSDFSGAFARN